MPAGHDFDALLLGALYGELSAVEESRLQAHLAAHPSDHEIFRQLTRTREAIRASAVLAIVEPPQAISALLLQEAARRVRRRTAEIRAAASENPPGRWMRWLSSLMAHPGLAAAAMAVLVVGVFGTLYLRDKHEVAEAVLAPAESRSASGVAADQGERSLQQPLDEQAAGGDRDYAATPTTAPSGAAAMPTVAGQAQATAPAADPAVAAGEPNRAPSPSGDALTGAGKDAYSVNLDDDLNQKLDEKFRDSGAPRVGAAENEPTAKPRVRPGYIEAKPVPDEIALKEYDQTGDRKGDGKRKDAAREEARDADKASSGDDAERMVQRRAAAPPPPASAPKTEVALEGRVASAPEDAEDVADSRGSRQQESEAQKPSDKPAKKSAKAPAKPIEQSAPAQDRTVRLADAPAATAAGNVRSPDLASKGGGATNAISGAGKISAPQGGVPGSGGSAGSAASSTKPAPASPPPAVTVASPSVSASESVSLVDDKWAEAEHVRLVRLVRANKCTEAARLARGISERAPRYYQDKLAGTSDLRVCEAAIRDQLNLSEQAKRKRAAPARAADEAKRK